MKFKILISVAAMACLANAAAAPAVPRPIPRPPAAAPVRPQANFNVSAMRPPVLRVPETKQSFNVQAKTPAPKPTLTRSFYTARDGMPPNHGFAPRTARINTAKPGDVFSRRGSAAGVFVTTDRSARPGTLGLDPKAGRLPMRDYKVLKPFEVVTGKAAPAWGGTGGAAQTRLPVGLSGLTRNGYVKRTTKLGFADAAKPSR